MFGRSNGESKRRGVGGARSAMLKDILDNPVCNNLCAGCGKEIPDPWYHQKSGKCFNCETKDREKKEMEDRIFNEVITLEARRDSILNGFGEAPQTDELVKELADIEAALQGHYAFFDDVQMFRAQVKYQVPL